MYKFKYAVTIVEDFYLVLIYDAVMSDMIDNDSDQAPQEPNLSLLSLKCNVFDNLIKHFFCHIFLENRLLSRRRKPCHNQLFKLVITK